MANIHKFTEEDGWPLRFILTDGRGHDITTAADLLEGQIVEGIIADKAYGDPKKRELGAVGDELSNIVW